VAESATKNIGALRVFISKSQLLRVAQPQYEAFPQSAGVSKDEGAGKSSFFMVRALALRKSRGRATLDATQSSVRSHDQTTSRYVACGLTTTLLAPLPLPKRKIYTRSN
jgi:hypothetical protein